MTRRRMALAPAAALAALALSAAGCGGDDAERAGTQPIAGTQLTIYSSMPHRGPRRAEGLALERGAALALAERRGRAGRYSVALRPLDAGAGGESQARSNGRRAIQDTLSVGYIGEIDSQFSKITIPQMNLGGVAHLGPTNSYTGLTDDGPGAEVGEPDRYYRTGVRTFVRLVPRDDLQGRALGQAAGDAGCKRVRIWRSNSPFGQGIARTARSGAEDAGVEVAGTEEIKPQQPSYERQAREIDADCLIWTGEPERSGVQILRDAAEGNPALKLFAASEHCEPESAELPLACTHPVVEPRSGPGREVLDRYRERFGDGGPADAYAVYGYEAMMVLLAAVEKAAADGDQISRAKVSEAVYELGPREGALGRYEIDGNGDVDLRSIGLYRSEGGELKLGRVLQPRD